MCTFLRRHFARNPLVESRNVGCFLGLEVIGPLSNNPATAKKTSVKKCVRAASNLMRIPSRSIRQMLANFSGVKI